MASGTNARQVFVNCPFDKHHWPILEVAVFTVLACGFEPVTALQEADGGDVRLEKLYRQIKQARFGIHDLSCVRLDEVNALPRFNMPFELGLFMACKKYGGRSQQHKRALIFEGERYATAKCLSDIAGLDLRAHGGDPQVVLSHIRDFLRTEGGADRVPGDREIQRQYEEFSTALPSLCDEGGLDRTNLKLVDYIAFAQTWLQE